MSAFRKKEKQIPQWVSLYWLWTILLVWGLTVGPSWLGQVHAKWREVRNFAGLPKEKQQAAIYGSEMALLQTKVAEISGSHEDVLFVVPEEPAMYSIANNPALLRAVTTGQSEVASLQNISIEERGVMFWHPDQVLYQKTLPPYIERVALESERVVQ